MVVTINYELMHVNILLFCRYDDYDEYEPHYATPVPPPPPPISSRSAGGYRGKIMLFRNSNNLYLQQRRFQTKN